MIAREALIEAIPNCLTATSLKLPGKYQGKVRDTYEPGNGRLVLVTTDRQSGFDRYLGAIPYKGQVLNRASLFWFDKTKHIIANHVVASPHANALIARKCAILPVEFVVRGYLTGSTDTSIWTQYSKGVREYCGHKLPEGMKKNEKLPHNIITPTSKESTHDRPLSGEEIIAEGRLTRAQWEFTEKKALELFKFGQEVAAKQGLILVDTKYEFGVDENGNIILADEIHTPDSSRYWIADTYKQRLAAGQEPDMIDKEFFRLWFRERCDPYKDSVLPEAPPELIAELSARYIQLFERITGITFTPDTRPLDEAVMKGLAA